MKVDRKKAIARLSASVEFLCELFPEVESLQSDSEELLGVLKRRRKQTIGIDVTDLVLHDDAFSAALRVAVMAIHARNKDAIFERSRAGKASGPTANRNHGASCNSTRDVLCYLSTLDPDNGVTDRELVIGSISRGSPRIHGRSTNAPSKITAGTVFQLPDDFAACGVLSKVGSSSFLGWSPSGEFLASIGASPSELNIWNVGNGKKLYTLEVPSGFEYTGVCWSPDETTLVTTARSESDFFGGDAILSWWNAETGTQQKTCPLGVDRQSVRYLETVAWSPDGSRLAVRYSGFDAGIQVLDAQTGRLQKRIGRKRSIKSHVWSGGSELIYAGGLKGEVWCLSAITGRQRWQRKTGASVMKGIAVSHDDSQLAWGIGNQVRIGAPELKKRGQYLTGATIDGLTPVQRSMAELTAVSLSADAQFAAASSETTGHLWRVNTKELLGTYECGQQLHFADVGPYFAVADHSEIAIYRFTLTNM